MLLIVAAVALKLLVTRIANGSTLSLMASSTEEEHCRGYDDTPENKREDSH